jgi:hypothetical protein
MSSRFDDPSTRLAPVSVIAGTLLAAAVLAFVISTRSASAEVEGPCTASIAGSDIGLLDSSDPDDAISVDSDERIEATMFSETGFRSHEIKLGFGAGFPSQTVEEREDDGETSFTEEVDVADYATFGVGLYKVTGEAILTDNGFCKGAVLVKVTGRNPLTTVAGGVGAAVAVAGTVGAVASGVAAASGRPSELAGIQDMVEGAVREEMAAQETAEQQRRQERWERARWGASVINSIFGCLCFAALALIMTPLLALTGGSPAGGGPGAPASAPSAQGPRRLPRARWFPRITLVGVVGGLLAGAAGVVLSQQFAITYPSTTYAITLLVIGAVLYGVIIPTLGYTIGWLRVNAKVARLERERGSR